MNQTKARRQNLLLHTVTGISSQELWYTQRSLDTNGLAENHAHHRSQWTEQINLEPGRATCKHAASG